MLIFLVLLNFIHSQDVVNVGGGSYASFPPQAVWDDDAYGNNYTNLQGERWEGLNLVESARTKPIPTNHWYSNYIFGGDGKEFGGTAWVYPQAIRNDNGNGIEVVIPTGFQGDGLTTTSISIQGTVDEIPPTTDVLFANFEDATWPRGWTASADFPYPGPVTLEEANETPPPSGFGGHRFVSTLKGDNARGTLTSPDFIISLKYIHLSVAGGNYPDETYVGLFINNQRVLSETGSNGPTLTKRVWDVTQYLGQTAQIRIVDQTGSGWGFILCDDIYFTDSPNPSDAFDTSIKAGEGSGVLDWTDIGFTYREQRFDSSLDVQSVHGVPFEYIVFKGVSPSVFPGGAAKYYDVDGKTVAFPAKLDAIAVEFNGVAAGIHVPAGTVLEDVGGGVGLSFPAGGPTYVVISTLPGISFLNQYNQVARNKPADVRFEFDVDATKGQLTSSYVFTTKNLDTGAAGGNTIMAFQPHHYRTTTQNFQFIEGATYKSIRGLMKAGGPSTTFTLTYPFQGLIPYMPAPLDLTAAQDANLASLISKNADQSGGFDGNTYAKGLGEKTTIMMQAYARGANADGDKIRTNINNQLKDWFTYDKAETASRFFAMYPQYGCLIGWPPGYGSQGFNDLHFHYGYFIVGAARLALVDPDFRKAFGPFAKFLVQDYANWKHYDPTKPKDAENPFFPFLRTFDAYEGHSYAGGTGDGAGNNQESTSEALNSWWGIYVLGVALNDPELIKLGAVGYKLEITAAGEYWFDLYGENFPDTYKHEFMGILRGGSLGWGTWFSGDPGWMLGIQGVPCDFYYQPYGDIPANMKRVWESMLEERAPDSGTNDAYGNIIDMEAYLGGYHLNLLATYDPETAAAFIDRLYALGGEWTTHVNIATTFYVTHAYLTYGRPAKGYRTSLVSGAVYENTKGEITYLLYNGADAAVDVQIFKNDAVVETINVPARSLYNSKQK